MRRRQAPLTPALGRRGRAGTGRGPGPALAGAIAIALASAAPACHDVLERSGGEEGLPEGPAAPGADAPDGGQEAPGGGRDAGSVPGSGVNDSGAGGEADASPADAAPGEAGDASPPDAGSDGGLDDPVCLLERQTVVPAPEVVVHIDPEADGDPHSDVLEFTLAEPASLYAIKLRGGLFEGILERFKLASGPCEGPMYDRWRQSAIQSPLPIGLVAPALDPGPHVLVTERSRGEPVPPYEVTLRFGDPIPAPPNDRCEDALEVEMRADGVTVHGDLTAAENPRTGNSRFILYYRFSLPQSAWVRLEGRGIVLRITTSCRFGDTPRCRHHEPEMREWEEGDPTIVDCVDLPAGDYVFSVKPYSFAEVGPFSLTATSADRPPPPANDTCEQATEVPAEGVQELSGDASGTTRNLEQSGGPDLFFTVELREPMWVSAQVLADMPDLYRGTCDALEPVPSPWGRRGARIPGYQSWRGEPGRTYVVIWFGDSLPWGRWAHTLRFDPL